MAKELPYFQFEPGEYLTGNIQYCSLEAQGLFVNIESVYWQRGCDLSTDQINRKFSRQDLLDELIKERIIKVKNGKIKIDFLLKQWDLLYNKKKINSIKGKKGAEKKWLGHVPANGKIIATPSENDGIKKREEKKRKEEIREEITNAGQWIETICMQTGLGLLPAKEYLKEFLGEQEMKEKDYPTIQEAKSHFVSWLKIKLEKKKQEFEKSTKKVTTSLNFGNKK